MNIQVTRVVSWNLALFQNVSEDAKFDHLGDGMCRGQNWQGGKWPLVKGHQGLQDCANLCKKRHGCVAFDLSPPADEKNRELCHLYGHRDPQPASGNPSCPL
jgi:hypothetical protein